MIMNVKPWIESVHLHPDVLKENDETDIFGLDLGPMGRPILRCITKPQANGTFAISVEEFLRGIRRWVGVRQCR